MQSTPALISPDTPSPQLAIPSQISLPDHTQLTVPEKSDTSRRNRESGQVLGL